MDLYKEYNRIRRNLMRQAKYHNISITKIPTAKQLISQTSQSKITKSNIKTLSAQKQSLQMTIKSTIKPKVKGIKIKTAIPKPKEPQKTKTSKSRGRKPNYEKYYNKYNANYIQVSSTGQIKDVKTGKVIGNTSFVTNEDIGQYIYETYKRKKRRKPNYEDYYKKYGATYTEVTSTGNIIDKYTGKTIGNTLFISGEEVGKYIYDTYRDKKKRKMVSPYGYDVNEAASEYELFVKGIQDRIDEAFNYYQTYSRNRSDLSKFGMDTIQNALNKFKEQDWVKAYLRYEQAGTMLKYYLDQALYYTNEISDHARAIVMVLKILDLDVKDFDFGDAENATFDMSDVIDDYSYLLSTGNGSD